MIPISRQPLDSRLRDRLAKKIAKLALVAPDDQPSSARNSWRNSDGARADLFEVLKAMAQGREVCMYCSDGQGASVDHYEPISKAPLRAWDWSNHILACSVCNSTAKRSDFDRMSDGTPLFLDPTQDDPFDHILLSPSTGMYEGRDDRGTYTADKLLNRELIARGRRAAWLDCLDHVRAYNAAIEADDAQTALIRQFRLLQRPNLDAFYSLLRFADLPGAAKVVPNDLLDQMARYRVEFYSWIGIAV